MLNIHTLTLGDYGTNCYIVHDSASETCCVIDPGYTPEKVLDEVVFIDKGHLVLQSSVDQIREEKGMSVDALFREVFKC